jgi:hypothetical protein
MCCVSSFYRRVAVHRMVLVSTVSTLECNLLRFSFLLFEQYALGPVVVGSTRYTRTTEANTTSNAMSTSIKVLVNLSYLCAADESEVNRPQISQPIDQQGVNWSKKGPVYADCCAQPLHLTCGSAEFSDTTPWQELHAYFVPWMLSSVRSMLYNIILLGVLLYFLFGSSCLSLLFFADSVSACLTRFSLQATFTVSFMHRSLLIRNNVVIARQQWTWTHIWSPNGKEWAWI